MDSTDASAELSNIHSSLKIHHSKRPWHYYRHYYSRRKAGKHVNALASTSHGRSTPCDERVLFKLSEKKEDSLKKPDRIRSSSSTMDPVKIMCGICRKILRRKTHCFGDSVSSGEYAAVAVLVCGHFYHADCLDGTTELEDRHDPPCPLCPGLLSQDGQE